MVSAIMESLEKTILCFLLKEGGVLVERLIKTLKSFNKPEASVRASLSQLKKKEVLYSRKSNRSALYSLTDLGNVEFLPVRYEGHKNINDLVSKIWNFRWLERGYKKFIAIHEHELKELKMNVEKGIG